MTQPPAPSGTPVRGRLRVTTAVGLLVVLALGLVVFGPVAASRIRSPAQVLADTAEPAPAVLTAAVERRAVRDTLVVRVGFEPSAVIDVSALGVTSGSRAVVTALPLRQGAPVPSGAVLAEVAGRPLIALAGPVAMYRDLRPGARGKDVAQLQAALRGLGLTVTDPPGTYAATTERAVRQLYARLGYAPALTGADDADQLLAAQRAVRDAKRAYDDARAAARAAASGTAPATGPSGTASAAAVAVQRAAEDLADATAALARLRATTGATLPLTEAVFLPVSGARVAAVKASVGGEATGVLLTVALGDVVARGTLGPTDRALVTVGDAVSVVPDGADRSQGVAGTVQSVATTPQGADTAAGSQQGAGAVLSGYPFTVVLDPAVDAARRGDLAGRQGAATIDLAKGAADGLVVPVTAVSQRPDGTQTVTRVDGTPTTGRTVVTVRTGVVGDGYVEVTPVDGALVPGDRVVVGAT